jgi:YidC/Oxa1 family membrane protein insertase
LFNGNFAAAVFVFTVFINVILIPLNIKTQKSTIAQARIKPKLDELKKKYGDDRQKYSLEMNKLYQEENVSMSGGCLPMLIRLPIMLGVYQVVLKPLTYIMGVDGATVKAAQEALNITTNNQYMIQTSIIENIDKIAGKFPELATAVEKVDFNFIGINLTSQPKFNIDVINNWNINWLIPIMAFAAAMLTSLVTLAIQKKANPDAPSMAGMMLTMPLMSLFIGFTVSSAAGFYWACSSLISGAIQAVIQTVYGPNKMIAADQTKELYKQYKDELEIKGKAE